MMIIRTVIIIVDIVVWSSPQYPQLSPVCLFVCFLGFFLQFNSVIFIVWKLKSCRYGRSVSCRWHMSWGVRIDDCVISNWFFFFRNQRLPNWLYNITTSLCPPIWPPRSPEMTSSIRLLRTAGPSSLPHPPCGCWLVAGSGGGCVRWSWRSGPAWVPRPMTSHCLPPLTPSRRTLTNGCWHCWRTVNFPRRSSTSAT